MECPKEDYNQDTKRELAKKAAIKAINKMDNGDIISIIAFDNEIQTIVPAITLNNDNRNSITQKINGLKNYS